MRTAEEHIAGWCRFRNDGYTPFPGPDGTSNPGVNVHEPDKEDVASFNLVQSALRRIGRGAYYAVKLEPLLDYVYLHGNNKPEDLKRFQLFDSPDRHIPREIIQLGMRKENILMFAIKRAKKAVTLEMEYQDRKLARSA